MAAGTKLIVWCTILPRDTDTVTQMRRKARAADLMRRYAIEKAGRVAVFDMASVLTNPTSGLWRAGMSIDGIHYTASGGTTAGYALADFLATLNASSVLLPASYQDTYDATEHRPGTASAWRPQACKSWQAPAAKLALVRRVRSRQVGRCSASPAQR